jgi:hypothetical protein
MHRCCPPAHGCNDPDGGEPCALELLRAAAPYEQEAAAALARWSILERVRQRRRGGGERRFRRRAYERVRDQALVAMAMRDAAERRQRPRPRARGAQLTSV